jgi:hypothetical protein
VPEHAPRRALVGMRIHHRLYALAALMVGFSIAHHRTGVGEPALDWIDRLDGVGLLGVVAAVFILGYASGWVFPARGGARRHP